MILTKQSNVLILWDHVMEGPSCEKEEDLKMFKEHVKTLLFKEAVKFKRTLDALENC